MRLIGLVAEAARVARSQPVPSAVTMLIVGAVCAVILATTGQTVAAERQVLAQIDEAGTRSIVITDPQGAAGLTQEAVTRIGSLSTVEWVFGLGPAFDVRPVGVPGGRPAPARVLYGEVPTAISLFAWDREPGTVVVGTEAQAVMGLQLPAGGVAAAEGAGLAVVGRFEADDPVAFLNRSLLVATDPSDPSAVVRSIYVLAESPEVVASVTQAVLAVLGPEDPNLVVVQTSEDLARIRAAVQGELGEYGRDLVLSVLGAGLVLVSLNMHGATTSRRRDFGRRRALGAGRGTIMGLVTLQTAVTGSLGALLGSAIGSGIAWRLTGDAPDPTFVLAVAVLAVLAAVTAALPPAVVAARRDPVRVLRVP